MYSYQDRRRTAIARAGIPLSAISLMLALALFVAPAESQAATSADGAGAAAVASAGPIAVTLKFPLILPGVGIDVTGGFNRYLDARAGYSDLPYTYRKSGTLSQSNGGSAIAVTAKPVAGICCSTTSPSAAPSA